jgi:hypothetical protein
LRENGALLGCQVRTRDFELVRSLLWPLHLSLTYVYNWFSFLTYYAKPSLNWLFESLNKFKWKNYQLQSFISFWDLFW